jgi:hypothetical protein
MSFLNTIDYHARGVLYNTLCRFMMCEYRRFVG